MKRLVKDLIRQKGLHVFANLPPDANLKLLIYQTNCGKEAV